MSGSILTKHSVALHAIALTLTLALVSGYLPLRSVTPAFLQSSSGWAK